MVQSTYVMKSDFNPLWPSPRHCIFFQTYLKTFYNNFRKWARCNRMQTRFCVLTSFIAPEYNSFLLHSKPVQQNLLIVFNNFGSLPTVNSSIATMILDFSWHSHTFDPLLPLGFIPDLGQPPPPTAPPFSVAQYKSSLQEKPVHELCKGQNFQVANKWIDTIFTINNL